MKTTIVIYGSSTGSCQSIAETIASKLGVEAVDVANIDDATIASHENLLLGTSTWGAGEMQDDWYDGVKTLKSAGLAGQDCGPVRLWLTASLTLIHSVAA